MERCKQEMRFGDELRMCQREKGTEHDHNNVMYGETLPRRFAELYRDPVDTDTFHGKEWSSYSNTYGRFAARFDLFLIGLAQEKGCDFDDIADGYGEGVVPVQGPDWSGIRDSSEGSKVRMFERALNYLFG